MLKRLVVVIFGLAIALLMTGYSHAFKSNIVAAWTFEEGTGKIAGDITGNGNDGDLIGGVDWVADGRFGGALSFDGSSGYVEVPFDDKIKLLNEGDFTLVAWFKPAAVPGENKEVFQQGDADGTGRTWLFIASSSGEIRSYLGNGTTASAINVVPDEWYHAAVVVTEQGGTDNIQVYVNGKPEGAPTQRAMEDSQGSYFIGCHKNLTNFWDGIIDEVALINKALDESEIANLMDNGLGQVMAVNPGAKLAVSWGGIKIDP